MKDKKHSNNRELDIMVSGQDTEKFSAHDPGPSIHSSNKIEKTNTSVQDYWTAWKKGLKYAALSILSFSVLLLALPLVTNNTYTSKSSIKIETDHTRILDYDVDTSKPPSYINNDVFYNTQYKLLRNRDLAKRVIDDLDIESYLLTEKKYKDPVYQLSESLDTVVQYLKDLLPANSAGSSSEKVTAEEIFFKNLTINPVRRSRIIDLHYKSQDPQLSEKILKAYIDTFIHLRHKDKIKYSENAKDYISDQIEVSRERMQDSEKKLIEYARSNKIVDTNADVSTIANNIALLNEAYIRAKSRRIDAESQYQNKKNISTLLNASADPVIQAKKQQLSSLQAEYQAKSSLFKPAYPEMRELKQQIDQLAQYINNESRAITNNTSTNMRASFIASRDEERKLKGEINKLENDLLDFYEDSIGYTSLKRDVDTSRKLYDGLLQRLKEINVIGPVPGDNVSIVDSANFPPRKDGLSYTKYLILGALFGLLIYTLFIFLKEMLFPKIRNEKGLKAIAGKYPILSSIPDMSKGAAWYKNLSMTDAFTPKAAEALRYLRTSLQIENSTGIPQVLHVTSPNAGDGKSTIALFLAASLANTGKKVLLIDGDLRKPSIHKKLGLHNSQGLTNFLYQNDMTAHKCMLKNSSLFFMTITAGPAVFDPVDTLNRKEFNKLIEKSRAVFDHIIVDSPPVLGMADSIVISGQADRTLLIVSNNITKKEDAITAMKQIEQGSGRMAGLICNKASNSFSKNYYNAAYTDNRKLISVPA